MVVSLKHHGTLVCVGKGGWSYLLDTMAHWYVLGREDGRIFRTPWHIGMG